MSVSGAILETGLMVGVIPLNVTSRHVTTRLTMFLSFYSQSIQKPLQGALSAAFCTKLHLIHRLILVWTHWITNFLSKNDFCAGQRVVLRPPRPIGRIALEFAFFSRFQLSSIIFFTLSSITPQLLKWLIQMHYPIFKVSDRIDFLEGIEEGMTILFPYDLVQALFF